MKILTIRVADYFFCRLCSEEIDRKRKALYEALLPSLQAAFPAEADLLSVFNSHFFAELKDYIFFDHFVAISTRHQPYTLRGIVLGEKFNTLTTAVRANGYDFVSH
ncbi:hypothetical protein [Buttiauxella sp. B2]|uniref:hypothetical protein n=1 Tax=Buttiauxella sp. B2 TaxID=2587812 RepID=UPI00167550BC|nr:hypothetical protein [Buttiauxella sp. B2]